MSFFSSVIKSVTAHFNRKLIGSVQGEVNHQAVKLVAKNCDQVMDTLSDWVKSQNCWDKQSSLKPGQRAEYTLQLARFIGMVSTAAAAIQNGAADREYWLLFDSFVDESDYQTLVVLDGSSRKELSRHTVYA